MYRQGVSLQASATMLQQVPLQVMLEQIATAFRPSLNSLDTASPLNATRAMSTPAGVEQLQIAKVG